MRREVAQSHTASISDVGFDSLDSLLNASMILGGMGPVGGLEGDGAKVFASVYALFCGLVFIGVLGMLLAPFVHRIMHRLHFEDEKGSEGRGRILSLP